VFASGYREPCVLADPSDPSGAGIFLYATTSGSPTTIVRTRSDDGLAFYGDIADNEGAAQHLPPVVLSATLAWEGTGVSGASALEAPSGGIWLYYAAAGGIGLAKSQDGMHFTKTGQPVLGPDKGVGWEFTPPRAPSVAVFPDGSWHMLFASGNAVGEATSPDGETWTRVDGDPSTPAFDPVLLPSAPVDPSTLPPGEMPPFDEGAVDDPLLVPTVDAVGRLVARVFYTGYGAPVGAAARMSAIGYAARFGDTGQLSKQSAPVYTVMAHEAGPAFVESSALSMLYVSEDYTTVTTTNPPPAIAAAFAPGAATVAPAGAFPPGP
jgi:hypothetical protein